MRKFIWKLDMVGIIVLARPESKHYLLKTGRRGRAVLVIGFSSFFSHFLRINSHRWVYPINDASLENSLLQLQDLLSKFFIILKFYKLFFKNSAFKKRFAAQANLFWYRSYQIFWVTYVHHWNPCTLGWNSCKRTRVGKCTGEELGAFLWVWVKK